jgi:hypothetical protein
MGLPAELDAFVGRSEQILDRATPRQRSALGVGHRDRWQRQDPVRNEIA